MIQLYIGEALVDIYDDISIPLTKEIADVMTPESRNSEYTKTVTIPATKANNALFSYIFDVSAVVDNNTNTNFFPDFNPNLKASCKVYCDGLIQLDGYVQLLQININQGKMEYEIAIFGQLGNLFSTIGSDKLSDLNFDEYDHNYTLTNITNSWETSILINSASASFQFGRGYVYPLFDYGLNDNWRQFRANVLRPALYVKTIIDKIFSTYGYTYESGSFFDLALFKRLIIPYTGTEFGLSETELADNHFTISEGILDSDYISNTIGADIVFPYEVNDVFNQYNTSTGVMTFASNGNYKFSGSARTKWTSLTIPSTVYSDQIAITYSMYIGTDLAYEFTENFLYGIDTIGVTFESDYIYIGSGQTVKWKLKVKNWRTGTIYTSTYATEFKMNCGVYISPELYDTNVAMSTILPKDILIKDFLVGIIRMFNLYIDKTDIDKELRILTREAFLNDEVLDWSKKLDISQPIEIHPMGMLDANPYYYTYKPDTDTFNKTYTDEYTLNYGDYRHYLNNEFIKAEKKTEVIFSPTVLFRDSSYQSDMVLSTTRNYDNKGNLVSKGGNIRILYYNPIPTSTGFVIGDNTSAVTYFPTYNYPYAGHLDDPFNATLDINWGVTKKLYYSALDGSSINLTNQTLFKIYYDTFIKEITDKNSKIVKAWFRLRANDILNADFRRLYYFMGQYFRLNKIIDHEVGKEMVTQCEFIKIGTNTDLILTGYTLEFCITYNITERKVQSALLDLESALTTAGLIDYNNPSTNRILNMYPMCGGTDASKNLGNFINVDAPLTAYGGLSYSSKGIQGNSINGYLDTGIYGDSLTSANSHFGYCNSSMDAGLNGDEGIGLDSHTPYCAHLPAYNYTTYDDLFDSSFRISYTDYPTVGSTHYLTNFTDPYNKTSYKNAVSKGTGISPQPPHDYIVYLGARRFFSQNTMDFAHFGYSLTPTQVTDLYNAIINFNTALDR